MVKNNKLNIDTSGDIFTISDHAVIQYMKRFRPDLVKQIHNDLKAIINEGTNVKTRDRAVTLMNNGYKLQTYKKFGDRVAVVSDDKCIITVLDFKQNKSQFLTQKK